MTFLRSLVVLACLLCGTVAHALSIYIPQNVFAEDSGLYYAQEADGSGVQVSAWADSSVFTWYTFDSTGNQVWLVGIERVSDPGKGTIYDLYRPKGTGFVTKGADIGEPIGSVTMTRWTTVEIINQSDYRIIDEWFDFKWNILFSDIKGCEGFSPTAPWCSGKYTLRRLTPTGDDE